MVLYFSATGRLFESLPQSNGRSSRRDRSSSRHLLSRVFGHAGQSTSPQAKHPWRVLSSGMWFHETLNPSLMYKASKEFFRGIFKFRTDSIEYLFNEILVFWFGFLSNNDLPLYIHLLLYKNLFFIWGCNILKFMPESSPSYSYITSFHTSIIHEHSLFQRVTDWHVIFRHRK
jgi:hypothetical protein